MDFNSYCTSLGYDPATLTADQRNVLQAAWRKSVNSGDALPVAQEFATADAISAIAQRYIDASPGRAAQLAESRDRLIASGTATAQTAELEFLRASRPVGPCPSAHVQSVPARADAAAIEAGLMLSWGVPSASVERLHDDRIMQFSRDRGYHRLGLHGLLRMQLAQAGYHTGHGRLGESDIRAALRYAADVEPMASTGMSTINVASVLSSAASKSALAAFTQTPTTWQLYSKRIPVSDFRQHTAYRLNGDLEFELVPKGGEIKHGSLGDDNATVTADTMAKMLTLDRRDIINDDLSQFATIPTALGRAGAVGIDKAAHVTLLGGIGTFFSAANGNYLDGVAGAALSLAGLTAAEAAFLSILDANGNPAFIVPEVLLTAPTLATTGRSLVASTSLIGGGEDTQPSGNPFAGRFTPATSPWLNEAVGLTGANDEGWFLLAGANDFAPLVVAFLDGQEQPIVESADVDFNRLGMSWRGYFDWGCSLLEKRGGVYATGDTTP